MPEDRPLVRTAPHVTRYTPSAGIARVVRPVMRPTFRFTARLARRPVLATRRVTSSAGREIAYEIVRTGPGSSVEILPGPTPAATTIEHGFVCTTQEWTGRATFDELSFASERNKVWVGGILPYASILDGSFRPVPHPRRPLAIFTGGHSSATPARTIANPTQDQVQVAVAEILRGAVWHANESIQVQSTELLSEEHLAIATGGSGSFLGMFGGRHRIDWQSSEYSHRYYIEAWQEALAIRVGGDAWEPDRFFVMRGDPGAGPDALDPDEVDPNWVVVDQVRYGRSLRVLIESRRSGESLRTFVEAFANVVIAQGSGSFGSDASEVLQETRIHLDAIGGRPDVAATIATAAPETIKREITRFFDPAGSVAPIGYDFRTLDGEQVGIKLAGTFASRQCTPRPTGVRIRWMLLECRTADDTVMSDAEELRPMVRIRLLDGAGRDVLDRDGRNRGVIDEARARRRMTSAQRKAIPSLHWTFAEGSEQRPIVLDDGKSVEMDHHVITFPLDPADDDATLHIRVEAQEFDDGDDDRLAADPRSFRIRDLREHQHIAVTARHDASEVVFRLGIRLLFD